jgi:hypothetical protein
MDIPIVGLNNGIEVSKECGTFLDTSIPLSKPSLTII